MLLASAKVVVLQMHFLLYLNHWSGSFDQRQKKREEGCELRTGNTPARGAMLWRAIALMLKALIFKKAGSFFLSFYGQQLS